MLDLRSYGAVAGGPDCTAALSAAIADAIAGQDKTIWIPAGQWFFLSQPSIIQGGISIVGEGKSVTILIRQYSGGEFLVVRQQGATLRDFSIWAGAGTSGGTAVHAIADAQDAGGNHRIQNMWITSGTGATWGLPLYLDGLNRTMPPIGIRTCRLDNVAVFNSTWWLAEWWNAISCEWYGGGAYQGAGTGTQVVSGGPLGQKNVIIADVSLYSTDTLRFVA